MVKKLFSVYDSQTELFGQPIMAVNKGDVIRQFTVIVNDGTSQYSLHVMDYSLFELGEFDESTGLFSPLTAPARVCMASELVKPKE